MPSWIQTCCSDCTLARAVSPVAPSDLGVQSICTVGAAPTKARITVSSGLVPLALRERAGEGLLLTPCPSPERELGSGRRDFRGGNQRMQIHLHAGLRNADLPAAHGGLRGLERDAVLARRPRDRPGVFQHQFDLLRLLALLFDQQAMVFIGPAQQSGRLVVDRRADHGRIGQPQGHFMPAFGQEVDLHVGRDLHDVLGHHGLVFDFRNHRAHGRPGFGRRAGLVLGRLPQLVELLIGQEHAAAMLLEDPAELFVGDVDLLLAERAVGLSRPLETCQSQRPSRPWPSRRWPPDRPASRLCSCRLPP